MYSKWQHNKDLTCRSMLPPPKPPFGLPPGAQVYLSQVSFQILFIDIKIFSINDTFFVILLLHYLTRHDGGSTSPQNDPTMRGSSDHSNKPSVGNTWAFAWWLVHDVMRIDFVMDMLILWWIWWLCDEYHDCVMDIMTLWWVSGLCDEFDDFVMNLMTFVMSYIFLWHVNWACINLVSVFFNLTSNGYGQSMEVNWVNRWKLKSTSIG
jgi:hypothetical protein